MLGPFDRDTGNPVVSFAHHDQHQPSWRLMLGKKWTKIVVSQMVVKYLVMNPMVKFKKRIQSLGDEKPCENYVASHLRSQLCHFIHVEVRSPIFHLKVEIIFLPFWWLFTLGPIFWFFFEDIPVESAVNQTIRSDHKHRKPYQNWYDLDVFPLWCWCESDLFFSVRISGHAPSQTWAGREMGHQGQLVDWVI